MRKGKTQARVDLLRRPTRGASERLSGCAIEVFDPRDQGKAAGHTIVAKRIKTGLPQDPFQPASHLPHCFRRRRIGIDIGRERALRGRRRRRPREQILQRAIVRYRSGSACRRRRRLRTYLAWGGAGESIVVWGEDGGAVLASGAWGAACGAIGVSGDGGAIRARGDPPPPPPPPPPYW